MEQGIPSLAQSKHECSCCKYGSVETVHCSCKSSWHHKRKFTALCVPFQFRLMGTSRTSLICQVCVSYVKLVQWISPGAGSWCLELQSGQHRPDGPTAACPRLTLSNKPDACQGNLCIANIADQHMLLWVPNCLIIIGNGTGLNESPIWSHNYSINVVYTLGYSPKMLPQITSRSLIRN